MTPEQWQQLKGVLHQALEVAPEERSAFLDRECASDHSFRREIESLLAASEEVRSSFLQSAAPAVAIKPGTRLGDYEVEKLIGSGGMGEVYRAHDVRLKRDVAIKVLPPFVANDPDRLRRFEQEARAAAALNHPNILAVYQLGSYEGAPYLVSELLEGGTLREQMKRGPLPPRKAVEYGVQIARGLAAAHEKGIAHRDLKPENLFVSKDGRVKILDFGLAKLTQPQSGSEHSAPTIASETGPGVVMGTVGYMSPEQVRGQAVDHRTDIFAFGAILYEMLSGKRAFQKATSADTMSAILNEDPAGISQLVPATPPAMQRVVHRCLEKSPEQRFQSASDLAFALEALSDSALTQQPAGSRLRMLHWQLWTVAVILLSSALAWLVFLYSQVPPLRVGRATQISNDGWAKDYLVTDGNRLYFNELLDGRIVLAQVSASGGETSAIIGTPPSPEIEDVSPSGSELLIGTLLADGSDRPLWILPLPAGAPRRLGDNSATSASWSPDGQHIAYVKGETDVYVVNTDGVGRNKLLSKNGLRSVTYSPDGQRLALDLWDPAKESTAIWEVKADGSDLHPLIPGDTRQGSDKCCGQWTPDGRHFVFSSYDDRGSDLWAITLCAHHVLPCNAKPFQLTNGPLSFRSLRPSKDGKHIFAVGESKRAELIRYDIHTAKYAPFLPGVSAGLVDFTRDGQWVAYVAYPDNTLWCSKADGSERRQLTYPPLTILVPSWSTDGTRIAFSAHAPGQPVKIYTISKDGGASELLLSEKHRQYRAAWGPDDKTIAIGRPNRENPMTIELFDLKDGKTRDLPGSKDLWLPSWSPDGRYIAAMSRDYRRLMVFDFTTSVWTEVAHGQLMGDFAISHDSKYVYFEDADTHLYRVMISGGTREPIATLKDLSRPSLPHLGAFWFGLTPDDSPLLMRNLGTQEIYSLEVPSK